MYLRSRKLGGIALSIHDDIKNTAISYANLGIPVIPLCSYNHRGCSEKHKNKCKSPGKSPVLQDWSNHTETNIADVENWFASNRYGNIGVVLGQTAYFNLVGVDIDGALGEELFNELAQTNDFPMTWEFTTGNGRRLLYLLPDGVDSKKHKVAWKEGHEELAFIAQGQQSVLPPSVHPSGKTYAWLDAQSPMDMDCTPAPQWIVDLVQPDLAARIEKKSTGTIASTPVVLEENMESIEDGNRSNHMARFVGALCAKRTVPQEVILQTALIQNETFCKPPLEQYEIENMVNSIWNSEMQKHQAMLDKQRKRQEMHPAAMAELFEAELNNKGVFWTYNDKQGKMYCTSLERGPWRQMSQTEADAEISNFITMLDASMAVTSRINEVYRQMIIRSTNRYGDGHTLSMSSHADFPLIALENGLFDVDKQVLKPWDPHCHITTSVSAKWLPKTDKSKAAKLWQTALEEWIPDTDTIKFLQEYIGYALLPSCKMRTAVFLHGEGANGKSLFIDVVRAIFENTTMTATPTSLSSRFGTVSIVDKLMVICSDIDSTYLDQTGTLKQIIAGDSIRAEYKGGNEFEFKPVCKLLFSANKLPKSVDKSAGWYSRLQFIHFPHQFEANQSYYEKITRTMSSEEGKAALLEWAIEGLVRLRKQGKWTISMDMKRSKNDYQMENDNVLAFVGDCLEPVAVASGGYKTSLSLKAVYNTYKEWCSDNGMKPVSQVEFSSRTGSTIVKKSLRWKTKNGWKTQMSLVDTQFKEGASFDCRTSYYAYLAISGN